MVSERWDLDWPKGHVSLHSAGGMLGNLVFTLEDFREVAPLYHAPWLDEAVEVEDSMLANLRGEFVCLPYGTPFEGEPISEVWKAAAAARVLEQDGPLTSADALPHGYCAAANWQLQDRSSRHLSVCVDYPETHPIRRLTRTISIEPEVAAIDFELVVEARRACRRPLGFHPSFALPAENGAFEIHPGEFSFGLVHPAGPEPGISSARAGSEFSRLDTVELADGTIGAFDRLPLAIPCEDVLMLCGSGGAVTLVDRTRNAAYRLEWDSRQLPSLIVWVSNRGRTYPPWIGRNLCVGVEPVAAAFLGTRSGLADNPIRRRGVRTAMEFRPDRATHFKYRLAATVAAAN